MSAFTGSDLEQILRANDIYTLVLSGVSSVGVVESTARHAIDMDYEVVVLADGCADRDTRCGGIGGCPTPDLDGIPIYG